MFMRCFAPAFTALGLFVLASLALAGDDPYGSIDDLKLTKPEDKVDMPSVPAPRGSMVLFDGKSLEGWSKRGGKDNAAWKLLDKGIMQVSGGDIVTKEKFDGTFKLHVEFRVPYMPKASGQ